MDVYVFVYKVIPTKGSAEYGKVGGASADVWVLESNREQAEIKAKSYIIDLRWDILELKRELVLNDKQILRYREDAQANYYQAKKNGISAFFAAFPPEDREDGVVEIWSLDKPQINKTKH